MTSTATPYGDSGTNSSYQYYYPDDATAGTAIRSNYNKAAYYVSPQQKDDTLISELKSRVNHAESLASNMSNELHNANVKIRRLEQKVKHLKDEEERTMWARSIEEALVRIADRKTPLNKEANEMFKIATDLCSKMDEEDIQAIRGVAFIR